MNYTVVYRFHVENFVRRNLALIVLIYSTSLISPPLHAATCPVANPSIPVAHCEALVELYESTNGPNWNTDSNEGAWNSQTDPCEWEGISCASGNSASQVVSIELVEKGLNGPVPGSIGNLTDLQFLDLSFNDLTGSIPAEIGNFSNLLNLDLAENELTGSIPVEIGNLSNLEFLGVSDNELNGPIPKSIGNLNKLQFLFLRYNNLTGAIPAEIGNLSKLQWLGLNSNKLSGPIPIKMGNLSTLEILGLSDNELTGGIPAELGKLSNLQELRLHRNDLTGPIPASIGNLANLQELILAGNNLTGSIPAELGNLANLDELSLNDNNLTGSIPVQIANLANLEQLWIEQNNLTGPIPAELGNLSNLRRLVLNDNELTGPIPAELVKLVNLRDLSLSNNNLTGSIPAEIGNLVNLWELHLSNNNLTGSIPINIAGLTNLRQLSMSGNNLTGAIPAELGNLSNLRKLELNDNELTGSIPAELANLSNLTSLVLSGNELTGAGCVARSEAKLISFLEFIDPLWTISCKPPVAQSDWGVTYQYAPIVINVLENDLNLIDDVVSVSIVTAPSFGTATVGANNLISYVPAAVFSPYDNFVYAVDNGIAGRDTATVTLSFVASNNVPVANNDSIQTKQDTAVRINVLANDTDADEDELSVTDISQPASNGMTAVGADSQITYTPNAQFTGDDSFEYTISDSSGASAIATVRVNVIADNVVPGIGVGRSIPTDGLVAHFETDTGLTTSANGQVVSWADQSDKENNLIASGDPTQITDVLNGQSVIDFDGAGDFLKNTAPLNSFPLAAQNRTVYMVANYRGNTGGFGYGNSSPNEAFGLSTSRYGDLRVNAYGYEVHDKVSPMSGTDAGWIIQSARVESNRLVHSVNGESIDTAARTYSTSDGGLVLGADLDQMPATDMQVAALLVYDRALSADDELALLAYLNEKYFGADPNANAAPIANDDVAETVAGGTVVVNVLRNDTDDVALAVNKVIILPGRGVNGTLTDNANGTISYTHDNSNRARVRFSYTVQDDQGLVSNEATVTVTITNVAEPLSVPQTGLVAHFETDSGVQRDAAGVVTGWIDQSDQANDLLAQSNPRLIADVLNNQAVIDFDGRGDALVRAATLNSFPFANQDRTVYMVANYQSTRGGFGYGSSELNQAFGLSASRYDLLRVKAYGYQGPDKISAMSGTDAGWIIQSARVANDMLEHSVDGLLIDTANHVYETTGNRLVLGADIDQMPAVKMQIAAVLVYNRALTSDEQQTLQSYLEEKYF